MGQIFQEEPQFFRRGGKVEGLSVLKKKRGNTDDTALRIENGGAAGAFGNGGTDLKHISPLLGQASPGGYDPLRKSPLQPKRAPHHGDPGACFGTSVGANERNGKSFALISSKARSLILSMATIRVTGKRPPFSALATTLWAPAMTCWFVTSSPSEEMEKPVPAPIVFPSSS